MTRALAILGASGHGKVVADTALCSGWPGVAFYDDAWPELGVVGHWNVEGDSESLITSLDRFDSVIVAIGRNDIRLEKLGALASLQTSLATLIHPGASVSTYSEIGAGSVVFASAAVNVDARLGRGVIINTGATIDHDCRLGDGVHVSPGAHLAGNVTVGDRSWVGMGAVVKQGVTIGHDVMIAAGAVVIRDVPDGVTIMGVPGQIR